jgi:type VI secretion system protein ImpE
MWLPLQHVAALKIGEPRRLRDLLWIQTHVTPSPQIAAMELGEVLMPALTPLAWQHQDDSVRLGRVSDWVRLDSGAEVPAGQKLLIMDNEEIPILELRDLQIDPPATSDSGDDAR